jgi:hypothetical protein
MSGEHTIMATAISPDLGSQEPDIAPDSVIQQKGAVPWA